MATTSGPAPSRRRQGADFVAAQPPRWFSVLLTVGGAIGFIAAVTLLVEKIALLQDPSYVPSCSISPLLSCGSVMRTDQAEAFGFPNPIIGVAGFAIVLTTGAATLAGAAMRRWYWVGLQVGSTFGVIFVHWLAFQSIYRIDALCPYCMIVWAVTIPLFLYTTLHNLAHAGFPSERVRGWIRAARSYHGVILTLWFLVIAGAIAVRFWDYWSTLLR